jgi:hypothetical protein
VFVSGYYFELSRPVKRKISFFADKEDFELIFLPELYEYFEILDDVDHGTNLFLVPQLVEFGNCVVSAAPTS